MNLIPHLWRATVSALVIALSGCAWGPTSTVQGPLQAAPQTPPNYLEHHNPGSLFQPNAPAASLFSGQRLAGQVGDKLKIDISEQLKSHYQTSSQNQRTNSVSTKGPGQAGRAVGGFFGSLLDLDATASGQDSYKGQGKTQQDAAFTGQIAVQVINVLPNGHLVVAGERSMAFNQGATTLRFSGLVSPQDIRAGNVVASSDVVNAQLETVGQGEVSDAATRSWLQRVLTRAMTVW